MPNLICVIDLETRPDPAIARLVEKDRKALAPRIALHTPVGATLLQVTEEAGHWFDWNLWSWAIDEAPEEDLTEAIETAIDAIGSASGMLVTFAGTQHDLPILRHRAYSLWLFSSRLLRTDPGFRHRDMMREWSSPGANRYSSLKDVCAALKIPLEPSRVPLRGEPLAATTRKSQVDVLATFLLYLYRLSAEAQSPTPLATGWSQLADFVSQRHPHPHLQSFAQHPFVNLARKLA